MYKSHRRVVSTMLIAVTFAFKSRFLHCRFHREDGAEGACRCDKRHFLSHLCIKRSFLPRQARDIRRESPPKKEWRFRRPPGRLRPGRLPLLRDEGASAAQNARREQRGEEGTHLYAAARDETNKYACCHDRVVTDLWLMTCD
jgi:hypothetical protein